MSEDPEMEEDEAVDYLDRPNCSDEIEDRSQSPSAAAVTPKNNRISTCSSCACSTERIRHLEDELELINRKHNELKRCLRLIECSRLNGSEGPDIQVMFMNTDVSRRHRHKIEDLLANVMHSEINAKKEPLPKPIVRASAPCLPVLEDNGGDGLGDNEKKSRIVVGCVQYQKDFLVDRLGWPLINYDVPPCHTPGWPTIPIYLQVYSTHLSANTDEAEMSDSSAVVNASSGSMPSRTSCFNCEGSHTMAECNLPRDEVRIRKNRLEAQKNRLVYKRYHVSEAKFGQLEAGRLSEQLLQALGLPADGSRLPAHVYRMRLLGYPPGWLLEAERSDSGLAMFDKHGREISIDGDNMEEEEYLESRPPPPEPLVDPMKLIDYPGFNAKLPDAVTFDDYKAQGVPPLAWENERSHLFRRSLHATDSDGGCFAGSKRPSDSATESHDIKRRRSATLSGDAHDMDIADDNDDKQVVACDDSGAAANGGVAPNRAASESPALDECSTAALERRRMELLQQLDGVETVSSESDDAQAVEGAAGMPADQSDQPATDGCAAAAVCPAADEQATQIAAEDVVGLQPDSSSTLDTATGDADTSVLQRSSQSIGMQTGTPVPAISEFTRLPSYQNFRIGIEDHIPYENLPDATGTYERMSEVLRKVRQSIPKRAGKKK